jgi:hypothetical protein
MSPRAMRNKLHPHLCKNSTDKLLPAKSKMQMPMKAIAKPRNSVFLSKAEEIEERTTRNSLTILSFI